VVIITLLLSETTAFCISSGREALAMV